MIIYNFTLMYFQRSGKVDKLVDFTFQKYHADIEP